MSDLLTRDWTGANGTKWTEVGFVQVYGGAVDAVIDTNAGHCGPTNDERIYLISGYPTLVNYKLLCAMLWANAGGAGRTGGLAARFTRDGKYGYVAEVDSNVGTARARIRRRHNGSWADVVGWTDVSLLLSSTTLDSGPELTFRVENTDGDTVALKLAWGATTILSADDTHANRIEGGGSAGVLIGPNCSLNDIVFDDLVVRDFEDEYAGTPADLEEDVALVVDGKPYSWAELTAACVSVTKIRQSYGNEAPAEFSDSLLFHDENGVLYPGAWVEVAIDGDVVAAGRLAQVTHDITTREGHTFALRSPKDLAGSVLVSHPKKKANSVLFNAPREHDEYDADLDAMTIGEAFAWVVDNHLDGDGMLRDVGAAPRDGAAYVQAELDALGDIVPELRVGGDVYAALEAILKHTDRLLKVDPATLQWRLDGRDGTQTDVDMATDHIEGRISVNPDKNKTAVLFIGSRPEPTESTITNEVLGGMEGGWPTELESTWTAEKSFKNKDTGLVGSATSAGGKAVLTPDAAGPPPFSMAAKEWEGCRFTFVDGPEAGNYYDVESNTGVAITATEDWQAGGPNPGDTFSIRGNRQGGGRDNGYYEIGRRFTLSDVDQGLQGAVCNQVRVSNGTIDVPTKATLRTPEDLTQPAEVVLDLPALGLINSDQTPDPCSEGETLDFATVEISVPTYSRSSPEFPTRRRPEVGHYGTAFSFDASKYGVEGAQPSKGDYGNKDTLLLQVSSYKGTAAENAAYDAIGDAILAVVSPLAREVQLTIKGRLDTTWAGLGRRLTISDSGGRTTGFESATDLPVIAVEWDPLAKTTTVYAGNQGAGEYDVGALRDAFASRILKDGNAISLDHLNQLLGCIQDSISGGGAVGSPDPLQQCAEHVTSGVTGAGRSVKEDITEINLILVWLVELMIAQKGVTDDDGSIWMQEDGQWYWSDDDGETWHQDDDNSGPTVEGGNGIDGSDPVAESPPIPQSLDDLHGLEGALWDAIKGIAANIGKTIDSVTGEVIAPGTVNNGANNPDGNPWKHYGPGGATDVPDDSPVPPTTLGGILANLGKTVDDEGNVLEPNDSVPADGAQAHGLDNSGDINPIPLASGDTVPSNTTQALEEVIRGTYGLTVSDREDPAGIVWTD